MSARLSLVMWLALALAPTLLLALGGVVSPAVPLIQGLALVVLGVAIDWQCLRPLEALRAEAADAAAQAGALLEVKREHAAAVREIHHRVKNNLQIVSSLLDLQVTRARSPELRAGLNATRTRIGTLALLHRHLYDDASFRTVDLGPFLHELGEQLRDAAPAELRERVQLAVDAPAVRVPSDQAVALGLIVTEAVGNALAHAFPGDRRGRIQVELQLDQTSGQLRISDDGVGLVPKPPVMPPAQSVMPGAGGGLGNVLMAGFAQQLGGALSSNGANTAATGTDIVVRFRRG